MTYSLLIILTIAMGSGCASPHKAVGRIAFQEDLREAQKLIARGHRRQAIDELTLLLEVDPKNEEVRLARAVAYQGLEEFPRAVGDYEAVLEKNPNSPKAHYNLGMIFAFKTGEPQKALEHFDRFLTLAPRHPEAFSAAKIMHSLDRSTGDPVGPYLRAQSLEESGREQEAILLYQEALKARPTCAPCQAALGRLLIKNKRGREGEIHLMKAGLFDPNHEKPKE